MNVPFSHPSGGRGQKDGRKVRWCWEGTFTFRCAPGGRSGAAPVRACLCPPAVSRRLRRLPSSSSVHFRAEIGSGRRPGARRVLLRHSGTHHLCPCARLIALYESSPLHGREIDLILECEDERVIVVEAKIEAARPPCRCPPPMCCSCRLLRSVLGGERLDHTVDEVDVAQDVGDERDSGPGVPPGRDQRPQVLVGQGVEALVGLVEEQQVRGVELSQGDVEFLLRAIGQGSGGARSLRGPSPGG